MWRNKWISHTDCACQHARVQIAFTLCLSKYVFTVFWHTFDVSKLLNLNLSRLHSVSEETFFDWTMLSLSLSVCASHSDTKTPNCCIHNSKVQMPSSSSSSLSLSMNGYHRHNILLLCRIDCGCTEAILQEQRKTSKWRAHIPMTRTYIPFIPYLCEMLRVTIYRHSTYFRLSKMVQSRSVAKHPKYSTKSINVKIALNVYFWVEKKANDTNIKCVWKCIFFLLTAFRMTKQGTR